MKFTICTNMVTAYYYVIEAEDKEKALELFENGEDYHENRYSELTEEVVFIEEFKS